VLLYIDCRSAISSQRSAENGVLGEEGSHGRVGLVLVGVVALVVVVVVVDSELDALHDVLRNADEECEARQAGRKTRL
jgi:hypothetical protein